MAIAHVLHPQVRQRAIDLAMRNRTMFDIDLAIRVTPEKPDDALPRVDGDAVAISILFRRRNDRSHRDIFEFSYSLKNIAHLAPLDCKLMFIGDVLISASAAMAKVRALRLDPIGRRLPNIEEFGLRELFFLAHDFGRDKFTLDRVRNKDSLPAFSSYALSTESDVFDF
jgi:hypothetical protein